MKKLFEKLTSSTFIRFCFTAAINTLFGYGIFAFFIFLGLHYSLATLLGTVLGILFNFKTYGIIVFKNRDNRLIFKFILVYTITYLCNTGGIALLSLWNINTYYAGAILAIPVGFLGYVLNKNLVYKDKKQSI